MNAPLLKLSDITAPASLPVRQRTLKSAIKCSGIALHSGAKVSMVLHPAPVNSGIVFVRTDIRGKGAVIPALYDRVVDTRLCTAIGNGDGVSVATIEHLMSALSGAGVDNVRIEIDGPEVPVMDGSAEPFTFLIDCAGTLEQDAPRRAIKIVKPVEVTSGDKFAAFTPAPGRMYSFDIEFESAAIGVQSLEVALDGGAFRTDIARARTFGFLHEVEALRKMGLARGGSMDNAVLLSGDEVMNEGGLRWPDEFVRHKILDAIGDTCLAGMPILGHYHGHKAGHALNNQLLRALFATPAAFKVIDLTLADLKVARTAQAQKRKAL